MATGRREQNCALCIKLADRHGGHGDNVYKPFIRKTFSENAYTCIASEITGDGLR